jgi:hypothetical protein
MNGKNKKLLWFKAGILIITLIIVSISSSTGIANLLYDPGDELYIDLKDSYKVAVNTTWCPDIPISGGTLPYHGWIDFGDGSGRDNFTIPPSLSKCHKYKTVGNYTLEVNVEDSSTKTKTDYNKARVIVYEPHCFVTVQIKDIISKDQPYHCEGDIISYNILVMSTCDIQEYDTTHFTVYVKVCTVPVRKFEGIISPCGQVPFTDICYRCCPVGLNNLTATVITDIKNDNDVPSGSCTFIIWSSQMCNIFSKIPPDLLEKFLNNTKQLG